jgi:hypothetical protein
VAPGSSQPFVSTRGTRKTLALRTTAISMSDIMVHTTLPRKTKIVCTMGPASNSEEGLEKLLDAGLDVARFNFSHGKHADHKQVGCLGGPAATAGTAVCTLFGVLMCGGRYPCDGQAAHWCRCQDAASARTRGP